MIHNGFYDNLAEYQQENPKIRFGFLKNVRISSEFNAYEFLHGYCGDFAGMLSDAFGYKIECLREADEDGYPGKLIHAYCVSEIDGQKAYIDVRGITTDSVEFFEEFKRQVTYFKDSNSFVFEDEEGYERNAVIEVWKSKAEAFDGDLEGWTDEDIQRFIRQHNDYYDTSRFIKRSLNMSRDWTPAEHYMVEQDNLKNGHGDIFHFMENIAFVHLDGKREVLHSPEEMVIRRQFPMLGKLLMDGFMNLHEKLSVIPGGVDFLHEKDNELAQLIKSVESKSNDIDENTYLYKWFLGKLDEHFYYSERNNELFCANILLEAQLLSDKVWVTVYKDALGYQDDENLTSILVPGSWLIEMLKEDGWDNISEWFVEYTADDTEFIARCALEDGVIFECEDKNIDISSNIKTQSDGVNVMVRPLDPCDRQVVEMLDEASGNNVADMLDCENYAWGVFKYGTLVGYCTVGGADDPEVGYERFKDWDFDSLCLSDVFIKEKHRGKGLASYLITAALEKCNSENKDSVFITVLDDKLSSLYERLGFKYLENGVMVREKGPAPSLEKQISDAAQVRDCKERAEQTHKEQER